MFSTSVAFSRNARAYSTRVHDHGVLSNGTNINDLEGHFYRLKPYQLLYLGKHDIYWLRYVYKCARKRTWLAISTVLSKLKDVSRSRKCCDVLETVHERDVVTTDH